MIKIKQIVIRLADEELHKKLKIITIEQNTSIQKIVEEFLKSYVEKHQKDKNKK